MGPTVEYAQLYKKTKNVWIFTKMCPTMEYAQLYKKQKDVWIFTKMGPIGRAKKYVYVDFLVEFTRTYKKNGDW